MIEELHVCAICGSKNIYSYLKTAAQMHPSKQVFNFDQCQNCELVFLNPRLPTDDLADFYTDYYLPYRGSDAWGKYSSLVESSQTKLDKKRAKLLTRHHTIDQDTLILDIGCGKPSFLKEAISMYNCKGAGIDFSDHGWISDSEKYNALDLQVCQLQEVPKKWSPDIVTMWHYLEHDYDPRMSLSLLLNMIKPGGTLVFEVPNFASLSQQTYKDKWAGWHTPRHTFLFNPSNIAQLLTSVGWQDVQVLRSSTLDPYILYWMSEMEKKGIDWRKDMSTEFFGYVLGMIKFFPKRLFNSDLSLGLMTVTAKAPHK